MALAGAATSFRETFIILQLRVFFYFSFVACSFCFLCFCDSDREIAARCTGSSDSIACIADRDSRAWVADRRSTCRDRPSAPIGRCPRCRSTVSTCRFPRICPYSRHRDAPRRFANLRFSLFMFLTRVCFLAQRHVILILHATLCFYF